MVSHCLNICVTRLIHEKEMIGALMQWLMLYDHGVLIVLQILLV